MPDDAKREKKLLKAEAKAAKKLAKEERKHASAEASPDNAARDHVASDPSPAERSAAAAEHSARIRFWQFVVAVLALVAVVAGLIWQIMRD